MTIFVKEDLWKVKGYNKPIILTATTNSCISDDKLIMGAGTALQAKILFPGIEKECYDIIKLNRNVKKYGFLIIRNPYYYSIGFAIFQTKTEWRENSKLEIIQNSIDCLKYALDHDDKVTIKIPFPGIGLGNISKMSDDYKIILNRLSNLPNNLIVCER